MELVKSHVRDYPYGKLAAHVLGHVGEVTESQLKKRAYAELVSGDKVGQAGVEAAFDRYLRGTAGLQRLLVDSLGQPRSDFTPLKTPMPGNNVTLTIDVGLQYAAERALEHGIRIARDSQCTGGCWNANGGAIVALDARNGEVLALASNPTFDPRIFVGKPNPWRIRPLVNEVSAKRNNYPGLNRALAGVYPPGSTFKPVTAIAALEENIVLPYEARPVHARVHVRRGERCPLSVQELEPVHQHGDHDADRARVVVRHVLLPARGGVLRQADVAAAGVGEPVRLRQGDGNRARARGNRPRADAEVASRHVRRPDREALEARRLDPADDRPEGHDGDAAADGALLCDGRERWAARHAAPFPRTCRARVRLSIVPHPTPPAPERIKVSPSALSVVREGLYRATHDPDGTSTGVFSSFPVEIAGKTGTAEKYSSEFGRLFDQAWWCGYGPADDAEIVVCALVENGGHGGTSAAPAALDVFAKYFNKDVGEINVVPTSETD